MQQNFVRVGKAVAVEVAVVGEARERRPAEGRREAVGIGFANAVNECLDAGIEASES